MQSASINPGGNKESRRKEVPLARAPLTGAKVAMLIVALGTIAQAASIPIFQDNFDAYPPGSDPGMPTTGEPWHISEIAPESIAVDDLNRLLFGRYRNTAVAPFSAAARQLIRQHRNLSVTFDYLGYNGEGNISQYFDIAGYDPAGGDPAFFLRFSPQENPNSSGLHDVLYLDPAGRLLDSNVDIEIGDSPQNISIIADFDSQTYEFDVAGTSATLPMFFAPDEIVGVEFANYGVAAGSGSIDNLEATVTATRASSSIPEVATLWMVLAGLLALAGVWAARHCGKR